jgi:hypothetical protein
MALLSAPLRRDGRRRPAAFGPAASTERQQSSCSGEATKCEVGAALKTNPSIRQAPTRQTKIVTVKDGLMLLQYRFIAFTMAACHEQYKMAQPLSSSADYGLSSDASVRHRLATYKNGENGRITHHIKRTTNQSM